MDANARKLMSALVQVNGASIGSMDSVTVVELAGGKKNPCKGQLLKVAKGANVMFFTNNDDSSYKRMVHKRLAEEGKDPENFVLSPRAWGKRLPNTCFVINDAGKFYVEVVYLRAPSDIKYYLDGHVVDPLTVPGFKPSKSEGKQGGLDNKVPVRTFKLESITRVKMGALSVDLQPLQLAV